MIRLKFLKEVQFDKVLAVIWVRKTENKVIIEQAVMTGKGDSIPSLPGSYSVASVLNQDLNSPRVSGAQSEQLQR